MDRHYYVIATAELGKRSTKIDTVCSYDTLNKLKGDSKYYQEFCSRCLHRAKWHKLKTTAAINITNLETIREINKS